MGQTVVLSCDAFPGREWRAEVHWISPAVITDKADALNTFTVRMGLDQAAPPLLLGQQVDAQIQTGYREDALKLPFAALLDASEKPRVALVIEGRVAYRAVRTGIEDFSHIEVLEGLMGDDRVIAFEGKPLEAGAVVTVQEGSDL